MKRKRKDKPDKNVKDFVSSTVALSEWEGDVLKFRNKYVKHVGTNHNQTEVWTAVQIDLPSGVISLPDRLQRERALGAEV